MRDRGIDGDEDRGREMRENKKQEREGEDIKFTYIRDLLYQDDEKTASQEGILMV